MRREESTSAPGKESSEQIYTVSALTGAIRGVLEDSIAPLWVVGEVSNVRRQSSGHVYFSLKDAGSQVACVLFRFAAQRVSLMPAVGQKILVWGRLSVYEPRGTYQLLVEQVMDAGVGTLQAAFEALKLKLAKEGLFDAEKKRPIPAVPRRVGVISSPSGAALQDFCSVLERSGWGGSVSVLGVRVQGEGAVDDMLARLRHVASMDFDLLVLCRGGGSAEDLWVFNDERLVRALAACRIPVITGVGHETDTTLVDFVADRRAETPTGAAQMIVASVQDRRSRLVQVDERLTGVLRERWLRLREQLSYEDKRLECLSPFRFVQERLLGLGQCSDAMERVLGERLDPLFAQVQSLALRMERLAVGGVVDAQHMYCEQLGKRLEAASVEQALKRGFAIVRDAHGRIVRSCATLSDGDSIGLELSDGRVSARVKGHEE